METIEGPPFPEFFLGLDLGKSHDYTALAVLERSTVAGPEGHRYEVRALLRRELGSAYPKVVGRVKALVLSGTCARCGSIRPDGMGRSTWSRRPTRRWSWTRQVSERPWLICSWTPASRPR